MSFVISSGVIVPPLTAGGVAYGTGTQAKVSPAGTSGLPLVSAGAAVPNFAALGAAGGGTGLTSPGASGNVLTSNGSAWVSSTPAAGGSFTATASGSIAAGNPVLINSSGQAIIQTNTGSAAVNGVSSVTGNAISGLSYLAGNFYSSWTKYVNETVTGRQYCFFNGSGTNLVFASYGTVNAAGTTFTAVTGQSTISPGSYTERFGSEEFGLSEVVFDKTTRYFYYVNSSNSAPNYQLKIVVSNLTGSSPVNVAYDVGGGSYTGSPGINNAQSYELTISSNGKLAIAWLDNSGNVFCAVATLTSSAPHFTWGAMLTISSGGATTSTGHIGVAWNSSNTELVVTWPRVSGTQTVASLISVSGVTCTLQSTSAVTTTAYSSDNGRHSVCFVPTANRYIFAFYTNASASGAASPDYAYIVAASSSGTALTYGTPVQLSQETVTANKNICFVISTPVVTNSFYVATGYDGSQSKYLTLASVSNLTITTSLGPIGVLSVGTNGSGNTGYGAFGYNENLGTVVNIQTLGSAPGNATITIFNTYRYTTNQDNNFAGFSSAAYTNGQTATINCVGGINSSQSSLTSGSRYYLQRSGILGFVETTNYAGQALSASSVLVKG